MTKLTTQREKFILHYHQYGNGREAYKHAFSSENMKENSIDREASVLLKDPKVSQRLGELRTQAVEAVQWGVKDAFEDLQSAKLRARDGGQIDTEIRAVNSQIDLLGLKTLKVDHTTNGKEINTLPPVTIQLDPRLSEDKSDKATG